MTRSIATKSSLLAGAVFAFLLALLIFPMQAQAEEAGALWGKNYGSNLVDVFNDVVELDDGGFIAVGQSFGKSVDLGNGITWGNEGNYDAIAVRCAPDGSVIWARNFGGAEGDHFSTVVSDGTYVYAVGSSDSKISTNLTRDFGIPNWVNQDTSGNLTDDGIVLKISIDDGKPEWAHAYGGVSSDFLYGATMIDGDTLCVVGKTAGVGTKPVWSAPAGLGDAIMFTIDTAAGATGWAQCIGGPKDESFNDVVYVSGLGLVACGNSNGVSTQPASPAWGHVVGDLQQDAILVTANATDGVLKTARNCGSIEPDFFNYMTIAPDGGVIVSGYSRGESESLDGQSWKNIGDEDMVAVRYDPTNDTIRWAQNYGGTDSDFGYDVAFSSKGNLYMVGASEGVSTNLKALGASAEWDNLGDYDAIATKIDPDTGKVVWAQNFGGPKSDGFFACVPSGTDGIYAVAGSYEKSTNLTSLGATSEWGYIGGTSDAMATKIAPRYDLTVQKGTDTTDAGPYFAGSTATLQADSPAAGQAFKAWSSNGGGVFADAATATTAFMMPANDVTVTAEFTNTPTPPDPPGPDPKPDPKPDPPTPVPTPDPVDPKPLADTGDVGVKTILLILAAFITTSLIAFGAHRRKSE